MVLHIDIETRSETDLRKVGLDVYAHHASTEVLMAAYAFDDGAVELWEARNSPMPERLRAGLCDPAITKIAWNAAFEFHLLSSPTLPLRLVEWFDPAAMARYFGLPGKLDTAGRVLNLADTQAKMKEGSRLIRMFCAPTRTAKRTYYRDWTTNPEDWAEFATYCIRDVEAERTILHRLQGFGDMPSAEHRAWLLTEIINMRGIAVDERFVANALHLVETESTLTLAAMKQLTGVANANSVKQLSGWLTAQNSPMKSLDKAHVEEALRTELPPTVREVLTLKQRLGGSACKKLATIQDRVRDGRLRGAFVYHGGHTGRWASWGVQVQNMKRPTPRVKELTDNIVQVILAGEDLAQFGVPVIEAVSGVLRASFRPREGSRLYVSDLGQIENRMLNWLADCPAGMDIYARGLCPYKSFATEMYRKPYDAVTGDERQKAKPVVLGAGFGMGSARLMSYAATMGVTLTEGEAQGYIDTYRNSYPEVPRFWLNLGAAAMQAVQDFSRLQLGRLLLDGTNRETLRVTLPSGRALHYFRPAVVNDPTYAGRITLIYEGMGKHSKAQVQEHECADGAEKRWCVVQTRGSKLVENVVQAASRDLLLHAMMAAHRQGYPVTLHCHDEVMAEVPFDSPLTLEGFEACMVSAPAWAQGLPLVADSHELAFYRK